MRALVCMALLVLAGCLSEENAGDGGGTSTAEPPRGQGLPSPELPLYEPLASRGTIRHHLRILLRADLLTERHSGIRRTYTLNDSSYEFPISVDAGAPTAGVAMALLRHPHRQAIVDALQVLGEADYSKLQKRLAETGHRFERHAASYQPISSRAGEWNPLNARTSSRHQSSTWFC